MIDINNLTLTLDNKKILKNINLKIKEGRIYGLIGPNGVGKTSLIKCLTGIYEVTEGEILYDGFNVYNSPEVKSKIAYVADENNFFTSFMVKDIMKYFKYAYKKFNEDKFHNINEIFKIDIKKRLFQLSKGQKMRVFLMIAFALEPKYMILDEPTSGLDPILKNKLLELLEKEAKERNTTIIISSHHLNELEKICDEVAILKDGQVCYKNTLEVILKSVKKIQVAFDMPVYEEDLNLPGVFKISHVGRVFTIITEKYDEEFKRQLSKFKPLFVEEINLCLEDVFIYKVQEDDEYNEEVI